MKNNEKFPIDSDVKLNYYMQFNGPWGIRKDIPWGKVMYMRKGNTVTAVKPRIIAIENPRGNYDLVMYAEVAGKDGIQRIEDARCIKFFLSKDDVAIDRTFTFIGMGYSLPSKNCSYVIVDGVAHQHLTMFKRVWFDENGEHFEEADLSYKQYDTKEECQQAIANSLTFVDFGDEKQDELKSFAFTMNIVIKAKSYEDAKKIFDIRNGSTTIINN